MNIIFVSDVQMTCDFALRFLEDRGHTVYEASDLERVGDIISRRSQENKIQMVIFPLGDQLEGLELLSQLYNEWPLVRRVITMKPGEEFVKSTAETLMAEIVFEPYRMENICHRLNL